MESRWTIKKKDGSKVGPYTSSEVREFLRLGEIDLYDWVYKENSKFTLRLIDTDEIFALSNGAKDSIYKMTKKDPLKEDIFKEKTFNIEPTKPNKNTPQNMEISNPNPLDKKIYYLTKNRKKFVGPVSANNIILKYKTTKTKKILIKQEGSDTLVKIDLFVKTFTAYKDFASQNIMLNNLFKKRKSSKRLQEIQDNLEAKTTVSNIIQPFNYYKIFGILAISIALIVAFIFIYPLLFNGNFSKKSVIPTEEIYENQKNINETVNNTLPSYQQNTYYNFEDENILIDNSIKIRPNSDPHSSSNSNPAFNSDIDTTLNTSDIDDTMNISQTYNNPKNKNIKKPINTKSKTTSTVFQTPRFINHGLLKPNISTKKTNTTALASSSKNKNIKPNTTRKINNSNSKNVNKLTSNNKQPNKNITLKTQQYTLNTKKPKTTSTSPLIATNKNYTPTLQQRTVPSQITKPIQKPSTDTLTVGTVNTLTNMKFSKAELSLCAGKCDIEFYNNKVSVRGIFFKGAYSSILSKKSTVNITGTVSKKGSSYSMFIQNIE